MSREEWPLPPSKPQPVKILVSAPVHAMITARQQVMRAELGRTVTMSEVLEDAFRRAGVVPA